MKLRLTQCTKKDLTPDFFCILHEPSSVYDPIPIFEIIKLTNEQLDDITELMIKGVKNGVFPNMKNESVDAPDIIRSAKENIMMSVQAALGQGDRIGCTLMQKMKGLAISSSAI